jgi:hypothetical protein
MKSSWRLNQVVPSDSMNQRFVEWVERPRVFAEFQSQVTDEVIGMICIADPTSTILVVSEKGYGKRSYLNDPEDGEPVYRITNRGGKV